MEAGIVMARQICRFSGSREQLSGVVASWGHDRQTGPGSIGTAAAEGAAESILGHYSDLAVADMPEMGHTDT